MPKTMQFLGHTWRAVAPSKSLPSTHIFRWKGVDLRIMNYSTRSWYASIDHTDCFIEPVKPSETPDAALAALEKEVQKIFQLTGKLLDYDIED